MPGGTAKHETLKRKNEFEELRIRNNVRLCKFLALVLLAINAILLAIDLTIFLPYRTDNVSYFYLYLLHIIISGFAALWLLLQNRLASAVNMKRNRLLYMIFSNAVLLWGIMIALNDLPMNGQISVYFIAIFGLAALLYMPPHESLITFSLAMVVFVVGLIFMVREPRLLTTHIINSVIAAALAFMVSRLKYVAFLEEAIRAKELEQVNKQMEQAYYELEESNLRLIHELKERRLVEERIGRLVYYDELTGIFNRKKVMEDITLLLLNPEESFAVLFIDLDKFKTINDRFGHEAGDMVLKNVALRLKGIIGERDIISRIGGDEFILILRNLEDVSKAERVAQAIVTEMNVVFTVKGYRFFVGASIGISIFPDHGVTADVLINKADLAMYQVKNRGGRGYRLYSEDIDSLSAISY